MNASFAPATLYMIPALIHVSKQKCTFIRKEMQFLRSFALIIELKF